MALNGRKAASCSLGASAVAVVASNDIIASEFKAKLEPYYTTNLPGNKPWVREPLQL